VLGLLAAGCALEVRALVCSDPPTAYKVENGEVVHYRTFLQPVLKLVRTPVAGADPGSFRSISEDPCVNDYATDRNAAYFHAARIPDADPASLRSVSAGYAVDRLRVYFEGRPVNGADPGSFAVREGLAHDRRYSYGSGKRLCRWTAESPYPMQECKPGK